MSEECFVCARIEQIQKGTNKYFVTELETGYVVMADPQHYRGTTIFLCKRDVEELFLLDEPFRTKFLQEMVLVAEAVSRAFKPRKINYELLGNTTTHLHWWIFPRYEDDPDPKMPVWTGDVKGKFAVRASDEEISDMVAKLKAEL